MLAGWISHSSARLHVMQRGGKADGGERENVENEQTHAQEWCCNSGLASRRYNNIKSNLYEQLCNSRSNMIRRCTLL
jgi:hypothetical protein